jgi:hypothetical protein
MDVIDTSLRSAGSREKLNPKNQGYDEEQVVIVSINFIIFSKLVLILFKGIVSHYNFH